MAMSESDREYLLGLIVRLGIVIVAAGAMLALGAPDWAILLAVLVTGAWSIPGVSDGRTVHERRAPHERP